MVGASLSSDQACWLYLPVVPSSLIPLIHEQHQALCQYLCPTRKPTVKAHHTTDPIHGALLPRHPTIRPILINLPPSSPIRTPSRIRMVQAGGRFHDRLCGPCRVHQGRGRLVVVDLGARVMTRTSLLRLKTVSEICTVLENTDILRGAGLWSANMGGRGRMMI